MAIIHVTHDTIKDFFYMFPSGHLTPEVGVGVLTFVVRFSRVVFAREKRLMVLRRQIHVIVGERLLPRGPGKTNVLRATE